MTNFRITSLARAAAISMAVVLPAVSGAATSAFAYDPSGGGASLNEAQIPGGSAVELQSAQSARDANPNDTPLARATAAAKAAATTYAANPSNVASDASKAGGPLDLNGQGGPQDRLGREIYHPGTGLASPAGPFFQTGSTPTITVGLFRPIARVLSAMNPRDTLH